jgi:carboxyl-terminal processing protease
VVTLYFIRIHGADKLKNRQLALGVAVLAAGSLTGGIFGPRLDAAADRSNDRLKTFSQILGIIQDQYVEEVSPEVAIEGAIDGMLKTLDPHTHYLNTAEYQDMMEEQHGSFSGLGIVISKPTLDKPLTVIAPIEGTPAYRAGIRPGDIISQIEGVDTLDISVDQALKKLRGPKGTQVNITVVRPGEDDVLHFTITRDDIPTRSVQYAFMIRPEVGFIRVSNFTQTTDRELEDKLQVLKNAGMNRLILDLRGNPGGLLEQAVRMADKFLSRGQVVVYTRGRTKGSDQEYTASGAGTHIDFPVVVLVNKYSASASEIVAGALQDHDRALIVGKTTWGKGLVQTVYPLSHRSALALTTAHYYTPSGRLIQRDYQSLEDYFYLSKEEDEETPVNHEIRKTDSGRVVYGGGGITPDVLVDSLQLDKFLRQLENEQIFFGFAVQFNLRHKDLDKNFTVDDATLSDFRTYLSQRKIEFTDADLASHEAYIRASIRKEVFSARWGNEEGFRVFADIDPQIQKALEGFPQAQQLAHLSGESSTSEGAKEP